MNIAVVTARSGSKGIPHKNIKKLGGIPLIGWTLTAVSKAKLVDKIIFSSDSEEYFEIAKSFNENIIFHKRTPELAEDVPNELVIIDVLQKLYFPIFESRKGDIQDTSCDFFRFLRIS